MSKVWKIGLVVLMVLLMTVSASAQDVSRVITPTVVQPNGTVTVTLTAIPSDIGTKIVENIPSGFVLISWDSTGASNVKFQQSGNTLTFLVTDLTTQDGFTIAYELRAPSTEGTYTFSGTYETMMQQSSGNISGINKVIVQSKVPVNISYIVINVYPTLVYWGEKTNITVTVVGMPGNVPLPNANVTVRGPNVNVTTTTDSNGQAVFSVFPNKEGIINVEVSYRNLTNVTSVIVKSPPTFAYVYATARVEGTTKVLSDTKLKVYVNTTNYKPKYPYTIVNTDYKGEYVFKLSSRVQDVYYIWIEPVPKFVNKTYVRYEYITTFPGRVTIEPGTTSVQANTPISEIPEYKYPNDLDVRVLFPNGTPSKEMFLDTKSLAANNSNVTIMVTVKGCDFSGNCGPYNFTKASLEGVPGLSSIVVLEINDTDKAYLAYMNGTKSGKTIIVNIDSNTGTAYLKLYSNVFDVVKPENIGVVKVSGRYSDVAGTLISYDLHEFIGTGYVSGDITDCATGKQLAGAIVQLLSKDKSTPVNDPLTGAQLNTTSAIDGHYSLCNVPTGGPYYVKATITVNNATYTGYSWPIFVNLGETATADVCIPVQIMPAPDIRVINLTGPATATINVSNYQNAAIIFVLDKSGSMAGKAIQDLKDVTKTLVDNALVGDYFSVVWFSDDAYIAQNWTTNKTATKMAIDAGLASGYTNYEDALQDAISLVTNKPLENVVIIFVSDGQPNTPSPTAHLDEVNTIASMKVPIFAIGFNTTQEGNETLMNMANATGGKFFYAPSQQELKAIMESIYRQVTFVPNVNITVTVFNYGTASGDYSDQVIIQRPDNTTDYIPFTIKDVAPSSSKSIVLKYRADIPGVYTVTVNGLSITINVTKVSTGVQVNVSETWQVYDTNTDGRISDNELLNAITDWLNKQLSDGELLNVIMKWLG